METKVPMELAGRRELKPGGQSVLSLLWRNLRGMSGDQGKDHVRPHKRPEARRGAEARSCGSGNRMKS